MSLWEDVKNNLVELYTTTSEKTTEIARVTTRKYDKFGISRDIERQFSELGNLVYTGLKEGRPDILDDPALATLMTRIEGLEAELAQKDREIDDIRQEYAERKSQAKAAAAAAGGVVDDAAVDPSADGEGVATGTVATDAEVVVTPPSAAEPEVVATGPAVEDVADEPVAGTSDEQEKPENAG